MKMVKMRKTALLVAASLLATDAALAAQAGVQPASDDAAGSSVATSGDIVVTARRREESLQKVPVAITALSGDQLNSVGVKSVADVVYTAPALKANGNIGRRDALIFSLRGINAGGILLPVDPGVAVYVDEVVQPRPYGLSGAALDLESVQVLYGPQGTLFGRNSTGGAILMTSRKPDLNDFGGEASITLGNYDRRELTGVLNLPIVQDHIALRVAAKRRKVDGFTRIIYEDPFGNSALGAGKPADLRPTRSEDWADDVDDWYVRASLRFEPGEGRFRNITRFDHYRSDTVGTGMFLVGAKPTGSLNEVKLATTTAAGYPVAEYWGVGSPAYASTRWAAGDTAGTGQGFPSFQSLLARQKALGIRTRYSDVPAYTDQEVTGVSNVTEFDITDDITIKNLFGYRKSFIDGYSDMDGTELPQHASRSTARVKHWSEELQLQGKSFSGQLNWIVGLYYFKEKGYDLGDSITAGSYALAWTQGRGQNKSKSVFAQATFTPAALDKLSVTLGGRYTWDKRSYTWMSRGATACRIQDDNGVALPLDNCTLTRSTKFSDPSYNLTVDYRWTPDLMTYIAHRRGYRSGGYNGRALNAAQRIPFNPEKITDIEIGLKGKTHLGVLPVRLNLAAYHADYRDFQGNVIVLVNGIPATNTVNAGKATIKGGEAELTLGPVGGFEVSLNGSITDLVFDEFNTVVVPTSGPNTGIPTPITIRNLRGDDPKYTWGARVSYGADMGFAAMKATFSYAWLAKSAYKENIPFPELPESRVPSYGLANLSLRFDDIGGSEAFISGNVSNLFNSKALSGNLSVQQLGYTAGYYVPPRMLSVEIGTKF